MLFHNPIFIPPVGIDLPELIRLKRGGNVVNSKARQASRDWSAWIDTIETYLRNISSNAFLLSGRDWSAWIDTIETLLQ